MSAGSGQKKEKGRRSMNKEKVIAEKRERRSGRLREKGSAHKARVI